MSILTMGATATGIVQICPCREPLVLDQLWGVEMFDAVSFITPSMNESQCLAIDGGYFPDEGSGAVVEATHFSDPRVPAPYQQWVISTEAEQVVWSRNNSLCLTVLPPEPIPAALVGIWPCGLPGFESAQSFVAIFASSASVYQLKLKATNSSPALCVSLPGSC